MTLCPLHNRFALRCGRDDIRTETQPDLWDRATVPLCMSVPSDGYPVRTAVQAPLITLSPETAGALALQSVCLGLTDGPLLTGVSAGTCVVSALREVSGSGNATTHDITDA